MRFWSKLLMTLVLVVSMTPGWGELLENLEHLVHDGHLAHFSEHVEADGAHAEEHAAEDEHGCTALSHSCACHVSVPGILAADQVESANRLQWLDGDQNPWLARHHSVWANGPPSEPPRA
ncbi:MAG: hypothetical protein ACI9VR_003527 [Cognaticolwellia sp.]|jgi:hypothetical protein